jgi:hypothetical protein
MNAGESGDSARSPRVLGLQGVLAMCEKVTLRQVDADELALVEGGCAFLLVLALITVGVAIGSAVTRH